MNKHLILIASENDDELVSGTMQTGEWTVACICGWSEHVWGGNFYAGLVASDHWDYVESKNETQNT